jgi:hypothetical protein
MANIIFSKSHSIHTMLSVIMLSNAMLSGLMLCIIMLSINQSGNILSVVMPSVIKLKVVAPE